MADYDQSTEYTGPTAHPYLHEPLLHITNVPAYVNDENIAHALVTCAPFRPRIARDSGQPVLSGTIEFKDLEKAEKALATLQAIPIPGLQQKIPLILSPYPPTSPPTPLPPASAQPRIVKNLPQGIDAATLYDLFRPYGALASVRTHPHLGPYANLGPDAAVVEFWSEENAQSAQDDLHFSELDGQNIVVQMYMAPKRASTGGPPVTDFNPTAPAFVPSYGGLTPAMSPTRSSTYGSPNRPGMPPGTGFVHGPGQQVQLAPLMGPGSNSHSGLIDPCNLFCKNLDPEIDSNQLFTHFRAFGQIVSARVMRNEIGESRGFGFVSYQLPDQANAAMNAMNGKTLGSKQVVVRLHEPKQLRQEKLAARFGHRTSSGATSPTHSDGGDGNSMWGSPRARNSSLGSPGTPYSTPERGRRGSGSYYNAALTGSLNMPMQYDSLSSLTPVVRKEVLTGELSRRIKTMDIIPSDEIDSVVESLVSLTLSEIVQTLDDNEKLAEHVRGHRRATPGKTPSPGGQSRSVSRSQSQDSAALLAATASAPEHPSTPISVNATLTTPPRTSSPSGSVPPLTDRDKLFAAICKVESSQQNELTELIMGLPRQERLMCVFNSNFLKEKVAEAKMILEEPVPETNGATVVTSPPSTPAKKPSTPSNAASPPPVVQAPAASVPKQDLLMSLEELAKLPAAEVVRIMTTTDASKLPIPAGNANTIESTDKFVDELRSKTKQQQKSAVGNIAAKVVKGANVGRGYQKVVIALLDSEDLRALAHLTNSYPTVLKLKAETMSANESVMVRYR